MLRFEIIYLDTPLHISLCSSISIETSETLMLLVLNIQLGVIHLWRPHENRVLTPLPLSICVHMSLTPFVGVHMPS